MVQIDVLYTPDDENAGILANLVEQAVADQGLDAEIRHIVINSDRQAFEHTFIGSPTIRINGVDPWLIPDAPSGMRVRLFFTDQGSLDYPTYDMLIRALADFG